MDIEEILLAELEPSVRELFVRIRELDRGCLILRFLEQRANVLLTIDDIAYHLREPNAVVERSIYAMIDLGLAREVVVAGVNLFGITKDRETRRAVCDLCRWQDRWHQRLAQIASTVDGQANGQE